MGDREKVVEGFVLSIEVPLTPSSLEEYALKCGELGITTERWVALLLGPQLDMVGWSWDEKAEHTLSALVFQKERVAGSVSTAWFLDGLTALSGMVHRLQQDRRKAQA